MENKIVKLEENYNKIVNIADKGVMANVTTPFLASKVINDLTTLLSDEVMNEYFMPLMNRKVGFLTDLPNKTRPNDTYPIKVVRDCLIDAMTNGLLPVNNHFNIIAGNMYPAKEGFAYLAGRAGIVYFFNYDIVNISREKKIARVNVRVNYEFNGKKDSYTHTMDVNISAYSGRDEIIGKAEKKALQKLYNFLKNRSLALADDNETIAESAENDEIIDVKYEEEQTSDGAKSLKDLAKKYNKK